MPYYVLCSPSDSQLFKELNVLHSFAYWKKKTTLPNLPKKTIIDSGAFSIWNSGIELDIDDYISFLISINGKYRHAFNFDVIGDAKKTYKNQKYIESKGLDVIPCFHKGSKYKYLKQYIDEGYNYIGLGGVAKEKRSKSNDSFLRKCFSLGIKNQIKFHGFGLSYSICENYPFYSIDSSTSHVRLRYGEFNYNGKIYKLKEKPDKNILLKQAKHLNYLYKKTINDNKLKYYSYFKNHDIIKEIIG